MTQYFPISVLRHEADANSSIGDGPASPLAANRLTRILAMQVNTILLVEDHPLVRSVLARALRRAGLHVIEAGTANEVRILLDASDAPPPAIDVVITELALPSERDGVELADWIRARHRGIPLIFTSGLSDAAMPHALRSARVPDSDATTRLLRKPFGASTIVDLVYDLLAPHHGVRAPSIRPRLPA